MDEPKHNEVKYNAVKPGDVFSPRWTEIPEQSFAPARFTVQGRIMPVDPDTSWEKDAPL